MKLVRRNKQKMSNTYKQAKEYFCKKAHKDTDENVIVLLNKIYWYEGEWCGVLWHSVYGDTYNFVR